MSLRRITPVQLTLLREPFDDPRFALHRGLT
jgi:hypothetical protein